MNNYRVQYSVQFIFTKRAQNIVFCFKFRVIPFKSTSTALQNLSNILDSNDLSGVIAKLDLVSLNHVLYRCKEEEGGMYSVPNYGDLVYAGLQGIASILDGVSINNDLGHPFCSNLRDGNWIMGKVSFPL